MRPEVPVQLRFGANNPFVGAEPLQMSPTDVGNDTEIRLCYFGKILYIARMRGPCFDNGKAMLFSQTEERERQPNLIIEIALCGERGESGFRHGATELFGGCFAVGTGQ